MKKEQEKNIIADITEFTDKDGTKWVQTSKDDLFSTQELNNILESIDKGIDSDEVILARIDFQKVNKEYYEAAVTLHEKLRKQTELLKKIIIDSQTKIEKKNNKLKELIEYIKKIHVFLAHLDTSEEGLKKMKLPVELAPREESGKTEETRSSLVSIFEEVEEIELDFEDFEDDYNTL